MLTRLVALAGVLASVVGPARASDCVVPICSSGFRWEGGQCISGPNPVTRVISHERVDCPSGWVMAIDRGECLNPACPAEALCRTRPACASDMSFVAPNAEFPDGTCQHTGTFGVRSHSPLSCPAGFNVDRTRGLCLEANCPPPRAVDRIISTAPAEVVRPIVGAPIVAPVTMALPDLQVDGLILVSWERSCSVGNPVGMLQATVRNIGAGAMPAAVPIEAVDVHTPNWRATGVIPRLSARSEPVRVTLKLNYLVAEPAHMQVPSHPFVAVADPGLVLTETNELNNKSPAVTLGPPPCAFPSR